MGQKKNENENKHIDAMNAKQKAIGTGTAICRNATWKTNSEMKPANFEKVSLHLDHIFLFFFFLVIE